MKKFFYLFVSVFFCIFCSLSCVGCKTNELDKYSKNLTSYAITAELDDATMQISGTQTVKYVNLTGEKLEYICFHLYPRAFRKDALVKPYTALNMASCFPNGLSYGDIEILKVMVNGEEKVFELVGEDEDILKVIFDFILELKSVVEIVVDFIVKLPNCTHRFGYYDQNINLGNWYPIVCKFENGAFATPPYYSTGDPFYSDTANYEVKFTYSSNYILSSSGEVIEEDKKEKTTATLSAKAVRDFAVNLSSKSVALKDMVDGTEVCYVGYQTDQNLEQMLKLSKQAVTYFNQTFGKYPYSTLTVVKTPFIFGGMEYPSIVFISDSIDEEQEYQKVIVHEIAHQWWYGLVGNNEVKEAWLDESLAEYSTALFFGNHDEYNLTYDEFVNNATSSYLLYVDVIQTIRGDVNTKMNLPVFEYQNDYEYSYMVYVKGVIMFDDLKKAVGEKNLIAGFKKYFENNKFKTATKSDFYSAFKAVCHSDIETFVEGYLNGTVVISKIN